jgi:hypothetical protein
MKNTVEYQHLLLSMSTYGAMIFVLAYSTSLKAEATLSTADGLYQQKKPNLNKQERAEAMHSGTEPKIYYAEMVMPETAVTEVASPVATPPMDMSNMPRPNLALVPPLATGFDSLRIRDTTELPGESREDKGAFRVSCDYSHMNNDDAIVYPNEQGRAHLHVYFGNTNVNYLSTAESIRTTGNSTCNGGIMNRTAYWAPAMIDTENGEPLKPRNALLYYKHGKVQEIPRGLKMIAGDMKSDSAQPHEWFECNEKYTSRRPYLVSCNKGGLLTVSVTFPDCWNGKDLDSADHKSHMAYSANGRCSGSHSKKLPTLSILIYYPVTRDTGTSNWRLSSDNYPKDKRAGYSSHSDFIMGWDEDFHKAWVDNCINATKDCHAHLIGDGRAFY